MANAHCGETGVGIDTASPRPSADSPNQRLATQLATPSNVPLAYAVAGPKRPGILTAVGVFSIVVGTLSILNSACSLAIGIIMVCLVSGIIWFFSTMISAMSKSPGPGATTVLTTTLFHPDVSKLFIADGALNLAVAVYLVVAGGQLLRSSPRAWRMHRKYVAAKFPLILLSSAAWWFYENLTNSPTTVTINTRGGLAIPIAGTGMIQTILSEGLSLIYPIALLIFLPSQTSKSCFRQIQGPLR